MEISCGTVLFTRINGTVHYVLLRAEDGYCGFPKGHMEEGETEQETALRETWEETSVHANIMDGFREVDQYRMRNGIVKRVIYFAAEFADQKPTCNPGFESFTLLLLPFEEAVSALTFDSAKAILKKAAEFISRELR